MRPAISFASFTIQQGITYSMREAAPGSYTVALNNGGRQLHVEKLILRP